jgi:hypothetical protein
VRLLFKHVSLPVVFFEANKIIAEFFIATYHRIKRFFRNIVEIASSNVVYTDRKMKAFRKISKYVSAQLCKSIAGH